MESKSKQDKPTTTQKHKARLRSGTRGRYPTEVMLHNLSAVLLLLINIREEGFRKKKKQKRAWDKRKKNDEGSETSRLSQTWGSPPFPDELHHFPTPISFALPVNGDGEPSPRRSLRGGAGWRRRVRGGGGVRVRRHGVLLRGDPLLPNPDPPPPSPTSVESFFLRRFGCAAISSAASVAASAALLGVRCCPCLSCSKSVASILLGILFLLQQVWRSGDLSLILGVFGIRRHQLWEAVVIPLFLTSLVYAGTLVSKLWLLMNSRIEDCTEDFCCQPTSFMQIGIWAQHFVDRMSAYIHDVLAWRTYVVAPLTEELVFRACMIPLLLCGGFKTYHIIFLSPVFFSLAHLNHFLELYCQRGYNFLKALLIVGVQLGYTVIFGWYAAFLFIRTGNLLSPIVAHIFCNVMGLPVLSSSRTLGQLSQLGLFGFTSSPVGTWSVD
uniref:intramembrane prenyl-peptidase Rce1 n=1 Tax=Ananas comosus var. bracteatus TaxID=296719 RepID=A0A6V7P2A4_ANACO|nr:unnamed protein product [Ananas comosus var. bracteatus]